MVITLCFDYYDEKSGMIVWRILLFPGKREIHAINHNTNRDMDNITICSTTIHYCSLLVLCATVNSL